MKSFDIPQIYRSQIITRVKELQNKQDPRRRNFKPTVLDFGRVQFIIPRHFGFCYGVQNAIEIAYKTINDNPGKQIFFLSEMIHNPTVNEELISRGVKFIFESDGKPLVSWDSLSSDDIVVVPAFGTTIEIQQELNKRHIDPYTYDTTCPFVEKVWKKGIELSDQGFTNVIHGKYSHEETRATFSHVTQSGHAVIILDIFEANILADLICGIRPASDFERYFSHKSTSGFNPEIHLKKFGVINQTTMLATETQQIMEILKLAVIERYGVADIKNYYADTTDTLCYATNENQSATIAALETEVDMAFVVGGYNSSNTSHLVELCEEKLPTFFIKDHREIKSPNEIHHFDWRLKKMNVTNDWFPTKKQPIKLLMNSGASCPDSTLDEVIFKLLGYFEVETFDEQVIDRAFKTS